MINKGQKWSNHNISRRNLLKSSVLGSAGLAASVILGCGDDDEANPSTPSPAAAASAAPGTPAASQSPASPQPKMGGVLRKWSVPPKVFQLGLDPHPVPPITSSWLTLFYQMLVRRNPKTLDFEPEIAQKWETVSPTELVFTLTPNVKFHNKPPVSGRALTAEDAVYSLERVRTDDPRFQNRRIFDTVDRFEAVDQKTLRIKLKEPDATLLSSLSAFAPVMMAREAVEKFTGNFVGADSVIGTGAFELQSVDDISANLVRNQNYWKSGLPYLDGMRIQVMDQQASWAALLAGEMDVTWPIGQTKKIFDEQAGKDYIAEWFPDAGITMLQANVQRKPFDDPRVTRALRLMIDHQEALKGWAEVWFGRGHLGSILPAHLAQIGWDFSEQEYTSKFLEWKAPKDEAAKEAQSLLTAAGFTKDSPLKFKVLGISAPPFAAASPQLLQDQWNKLSGGTVQTELQLADLATVQSFRIQGEFDYWLTNIGASIDYEPDSWFRTLYRTGGGRNYGRYSNPELDALVDKTRAIFDTGERKAKTKELIQYVIDKTPYSIWSGFDTLNARRRPVHDTPLESYTAVWGYAYDRSWLDS